MNRICVYPNRPNRGFGTTDNAIDSTGYGLVYIRKTHINCVTLSFRDLACRLFFGTQVILVIFYGTFNNVCWVSILPLNNLETAFRLRLIA